MTALAKALRNISKSTDKDNTAAPDSKAEDLADLYSAYEKAEGASAKAKALRDFMELANS